MCAHTQLRPRGMQVRLAMNRKSEFQIFFHIENKNVANISFQPQVYSN